MEYALVAAALIAVAAGLAAFWHFAAQGSFASAAAESLSHRLARGGARYCAVLKGTGPCISKGASG